MNRSSAVLLGCSLLLGACAHTPPPKDGDTKASASSDNGSKTVKNKAATDHDGKPSADSDNDRTRTKNAVRIETALVYRGTLPRLVVGYGSVGGGANAKAELGFPEAGRIASVDVSVGNRVPAGAVLARLDPRPFQAEADEAQANVTAALAVQTKARLGVRPQQIAQTDAQMRQAKTQVSIARAQADREAKLLALGIAAQSDVDVARAALANVEGQLEVLQQQRSSEIHPWQPDVEVANAGVAQARSAARAASQKVAMTQLVAPFAGTVVARLHNDGESVDASTPVVELANDAAPVFTAQFAPSDAAQLRVGQRATVTAQGIKAQVSGEIVAVNPSQSDAHTVSVLIRVHPPLGSNGFGPGAYGKASVAVGARRGLIVPEPAIVTDVATGAVQVFRQHGARFDPVPITVGERFHGKALVTAQDLRPGDRVATQGAYELLTPQQVPKKDAD